MSVTDIVYTDASSHGWARTYNEQRVNGRSADTEKLQSINTLEPLVMKFAINTFQRIQDWSHQNNG